MFLITTACRQFWRTDGKVLFLGRWCNIYNHRGDWEKLDFEILPYHWDDRERLYADYSYLRGVYERYLSELSEKLNRLHNVDHSLRYWRILIGTWLSLFIEIFYDRFLSVSTASDSKKVRDTWIVEPSKSGQWIPKDYTQFQRWFISDEYNHYLYSILIKKLADFHYTIKKSTVPKNSSNKKISSCSGTPKARSVIKNMASACSKHIPDALNRIVIINAFNRQQLIRLQLALGQIPYMEPDNIAIESYPINASLRRELKTNKGTGTFEHLLDEQLAEQIPTAYVEGYKKLRDSALKAYPKKPKLILTANSDIANDTFKMWAAHNIDRHAKLALVQHGGHFGTGKWCSLEYNQILAADRYYSWGWKDSKRNSIKPLPTARLVKQSALLSGDILLVTNSFSRYSYRMFSIPIAGQSIDYLDEQFRFVENLEHQPFKLTCLRLYNQDYGWNERSRWDERFPGLKVYKGSLSIYEHLAQSRLCIVTSNTTTYLETLSADFPTIIFWNPRHWELNRSAELFFNELGDAGIFHKTPESAASKVNQIYDEPQRWWTTPRVQKARANFCHQFARTSKDWLREWKTELKNLADQCS